MKAQIHVIETVIACSLIAGALILFIYRPPPPPELTKLNYKLDAYNGLKILDESGNLRKYALENNATKIKELLSPYIRINYEVALLNETTNITPLPTFPKKEILSVRYFLAGNAGNFTAREVRVYLWD